MSCWAPGRSHGLRTLQVFLSGGAGECATTRQADSARTRASTPRTAGATTVVPAPSFMTARSAPTAPTAAPATGHRHRHHRHRRPRHSTRPRLHLRRPPRLPPRPRCSHPLPMSPHPPLPLRRRHRTSPSSPALAPPIPTPITASARPTFRRLTASSRRVPSRRLRSPLEIA